MTKRSIFRGLYKLCECKCGELMSILDSEGRLRRFKKGHNTRTIDQKGEKSRTWKGGRYPDDNGYWHIYMPEYFRSNKAGYVYEHVYNYQESHKCCMLSWGEVHHRVPVTKDVCINLPWNLVGMTNRRHMSIHMKGNKHKLIDMSGWFCSQCRSKETLIKKENGRPHWHDDKKGGHLCNKCSNKVYRKSLKKN